MSKINSHRWTCYVWFRVCIKNNLIWWRKPWTRFWSSSRVMDKLFDIWRNIGTTSSAKRSPSVQPYCRHCGWSVYCCSATGLSIAWRLWPWNGVDGFIRWKLHKMVSYKNNLCIITEDYNYVETHIILTLRTGSACSQRLNYVCFQIIIIKGWIMCVADVK